MLLKSFKYWEPGWSLDGISLGLTNLMVGKNSSGKSRALESLGSIIAFISQRKKKFLSPVFNVELNFIEENNDIISYSLSLEGGKVSKEELITNNHIIIQRTAASALFEGETVNPPANMLLIHVRRDVEKYPVIEKIIKWAEESIIRSFTDDYAHDKKGLYELFEKFSPEMKSHLIEMINSVGFPVAFMDTFESILAKTNNGGADIHPDATEFKVIILQEKDVNVPLFLKNLSSGMYRTILLLVLIEQMVSHKKPALLAIDDLGEGLDYSRAKKLGELIFRVCEHHHIQLIATSNEEFMMNIVDINQWNVLVRKGEAVKTITSETCPEEFEDFKFSGLSNFDFFTSSFLNRITSKLFSEQQ